ncbi:peptidoglycan DD-metalloendopeptidase family protein [Catenovulum sp. 2E275]|uniref:peptidoglycan DD-metalloendopeptidase family protein n=1 Tax=Catenovulum sp. 2E275 TaxID=2980497 RepID=UPI0021CE2A32|nr:peptidoglycan DD-metalloendopeptidase family protein [Catenovulum sp. 2E275]MCU4677462.1 peptidoglycan DD-metalloendopeptidase family protein [Catenovulum sp. 2E275]
MRVVARFWRDFPTLHKVYIASIAFILAIFIIFPFEDATASRQNEPASSRLKPGVRYNLDLEQVEPQHNQAHQTDSLNHTIDNSAVDKERDSTTLTNNEAIAESVKVMDEVAEKEQIQAEPELDWKDVKVLKNDSLAKIFDRNGLSAKTLLLITKSGDAANTLVRKLMPGQVIQLGYQNDEFVQLVYPLSKTELIEIHKTQDGFKAQEIKKQVDVKESFAAAKITSNFWNAGLQAGLTNTQIMNLANVFGWDVDFALDIREGDSFAVVFEELYVEGEYVGPGDILAAEFINQGANFAAVRHTDGEYYTPEGRSMRKAFLRAPVNFKYISSNFNPRRLHPVTGRVAPHRGIDYAARVGTPVVSAGDGRVIKSGYNSLNGNYVFIEHGKTYITKYLHLNKRYVKTGQKVKQNQKIGTVGATGRVTGAHLHYEFLVNGVHRNPKTVELPKALPIDPQEKMAFSQISDKMIAMIETNKRVLVAAK